MKLLLIESGGKLKKLKQILGSGWNIKATMGHIVELANDGSDSLGFTLVDFGVNTPTVKQPVPCLYTSTGMALPSCG